MEDDTSPADRRSYGDRTVEIIASSTLRVGLAIFGLVLLLFAIGQLVGVDILGMIVNVLESPEGRWAIVAFVALVMIVLALRGFNRSE